MSSRSRNLNRSYFRNVYSRYRDLLSRKKIPLLAQWTTPTNRPIKSTTGVTEIEHIWKTGDRYYKLSNTYYGNPEYWWVIARYNFAPTEGHLKSGRLIIIPTPLNRVLALL
jgi:nucleoid-associated protein YgaU